MGSSGPAHKLFSWVLGAAGFSTLPGAEALPPGLALGYLRGGDHPDQLVLTKAGGFGADDLFVTLAAGRAR